jgi:serine O-acetyltransferase
MLDTIRRDVRSVFDRDPAARTTLEVLLCTPGLHAIWAHRLAHWLWTHGFKLPARCLSQFMRGLTGIEIHPGATIGPGFFIDHGMAVVIGETTNIGEDVSLYQGVTLGGTSNIKGKRHPTIDDRVVIGAGAKVLGAITVGQGSRIGANAVVVKPVPPDSVVVGVPGQVIVRSSRDHAPRAPDLEHTSLPDTLGTSVASLLERVEVLERRLDVHDHSAAGGDGHVHPPDGGAWRGEDFAI